MERLKQLRLEKNLSQKKLAESLGISQQLINNYENGHHEPGIALLKKTALFFAVTIDYLVGLGNERQPSLKSGEAELIKLYRTLPDKVQQNAFNLLKSISEMPKQ